MTGSPSDVPPLKVLQVGAGGMGRAWLSAIAANPDVELVGLVDLDAAVAAAALAAAPAGLSERDVTVGTDLLEVARTSGASAVVDVTVPTAHHPVTTAALFAGLDVLGEKPVTETVAEALSLVAATQLTGRRFVVSQSRRFNQQAFQLRAFAQALGAAGTLACEFFKAPHFGGFREQMPHPLLVDMAIHQFDLARFVLDADPVAVYAEAFNPRWSWYAGDASAVATFEMSDGSRFSYSGSWCAPGLETSWNGSWRLSAEGGSAIWTGDDAPSVESVEPIDVAEVADPGRELAGSLAAFVAGIRDGAPLMCEAADNVLSLAMVEAAVASATSGQRVAIDDVLDRAYEAALARETRDDVREALAAWPSVLEGLASPAV
ncbi:Gfo/Idh/MocA family protein [Pseudactinotalea suaedae]|uniref:Gfo/Idh/MocA family protein n=1 Tax=Pseudactinotalea suaedae TaxID=1524924 RepID=UPI001F4F46C9|nr:Gfo/Idh/MocA family oxidoreductase [Pseudactinotalea suaedae]